MQPPSPIAAKAIDAMHAAKNDAIPDAPPPLPASLPDFPPAPAGSPAELLRNPDGLAAGILAGHRNAARLVGALATGLCGFALYGFAAGFFAGWRIALVDAVKGAGIAAFAYALCLPALYVFASLGGARLSAAQILTLGATSFGTAGLLFAALAPVLWIFAVSTSSAAFIALLFFGAILIALFFTLQPAKALARRGAFGSIAGMRVWLALLVVVALQTVTLVRPMLAEAPEKDSKADEKRREKCFFLTHFFMTVDGDSSGVVREINHK